MPNVNPIDNKTNYTNVSNETVNSSNNVPSYVLNNSSNTGDTFTKEGDKKESTSFLGSIWQSIASIPQSIANLPIWKKDTPDNPAELSTEEKLKLAHSSTDINILSRLMNDPDPNVRANVADNLNVKGSFSFKTKEIFWEERLKISRKLADDPDSSVKIALINNYEEEFVPDDVRIKLSKDPDPAVRKANIEYYTKWWHPQPPYTLELVNDPDPAVRTELAKAIRLPENITQQLSNDPDAAVRTTIAKNGYTSDAILMDIATRDKEDPEVKKAALEQLRKRDRTKAANDAYIDAAIAHEILD